MNLYEAKKILNRNGFNLIKEDVSVWPPEGPELPLDEWEAEVTEIVKSDAKCIEDQIKEKYPTVEVWPWDAEPYDDNIDDTDEGYSKDYKCKVELVVPPEALDLTPETAKGKKLPPSGLYDLSEEASELLNNLWSTYANNTEVEYTDEYDSYYDAEDNTCRLQMLGIYTYSP